MTPKQISEKYVHGHHDALTDEQEKRDMAADIEKYANERCREIALEAEKLGAAVESNTSRCSSCRFWRPIKGEKHMGDCTLLSGKSIKDGEEIMGRKYHRDEYPETEKTGIESYPVCHHDGRGFFYETKIWFGCVHHKPH